MPIYYYVNPQGDLVELGRVTFPGEHDQPAITLHVTEITAEANQWCDLLAAGCAPRVEYASAYTSDNPARPRPELLDA